MLRPLLLGSYTSGYMNGRALRDSALRVAYFGDSTANYGTANSDSETINVPFPASGNTTSIALSTLERTALPTYFPVNVVANGGISGQSTSAMVSREVAAASATRKAVADILAKDPDVIFARCGSINDLTGLSVAGVAAQVATTLANHRLLINRLSSAGALVIDGGIAGYNDGSAGTATDQVATRLALTQLNAQYKADAESSGGKVVFLDPIGLLSDSAGSFLSGMSNDGRHLSIAGSKALANAEQAIIAPVLGASVNRFNGANVFPNALFASTGAIASGTAATGIVPTATNGALSGSAVVFESGKVWQVTTVTATGIGTVTLTAALNLASMGVVSGNSVGIEFDFFVERPDGLNLSEIGPILGRLDMTQSGKGRIVIDAVTSSQQIPTTPRISGRVIFPVIVMPVDPATLSVQNLLLQVSTRFATQVLRIGITPPRIVINPA